MKIGRQWEDRLRIWGEQFQKHIVAKHALLPVSYFTTMAHLTLEQAAQGPFVPAPVGLKWGKKWEYGWFHTSFTVPFSLEGKRITLHLGVGEEMLVFVNGKACGAIDKRHGYITLSRSAKAGEVFDVYAECYAGHGPRMEGAGPIAAQEEAVPEPPLNQVTIGESYAGIWNETMFQAAMDYHTLYSLVWKLPPKSLRAMKIVEGLKCFTCIADFELPEDEMTQSVAEAAKVLAPLLACKNGSTAPEFTVFGQSHLDMAWLWPVEETMRKSARTYTNQLALMEEYPQYRFLLCEPPILEYLKTLYPQVYARVREHVERGAFIPEGAMWIESDTNIPSGESLIRQFVWGRRWFKEELGTESRMAWMPDTFGFSAALPQIMKKCGISYFATQKLLRQDPEAEPFPYNLFWWEGMDGSRVLTHVFKKNNAVFTPGDLITRWEEDRIQQTHIDGFMFPFGYGDGGGGPTREMLEMARRCADLEGAPRCHMESPVRFFERAQQQEIPHVFRGEMYLAWHRGTLTAQAKTKRGIRRAEAALKRIEYHMARRVASGEGILAAWKREVQALWKLLLFNQFHDIAPGTSIERVHQRAETELAQVEAGCDALLQAMLGGDCGELAVYNHTCFDRMYHGVHVPAQGAVRLGEMQPLEQCEKATVRRMERAQGACYELKNSHLTCSINALGEIERIWDAKGREYLASTGNRLLLFKDVNTCYDAWEMGSMYEQMPVCIPERADIEIEDEPFGAAIRVRRMVGDSLFTQRIVLEDVAQCIRFDTKIDWREKHKLLKVAFPVDVYANEAVHEIQFGHVKRPVHRSRQHDADQYEVCNHRYTALCDGALGAAVLNDCKYGVNVIGNEIRLTLLRAPLMPDMHADQGVQTMTYAFYPFAGTLADSDVLREASALNEPLFLGSTQAVKLHDAPICLAKQKNIIVDTIKPADQVENGVIVRVYEAMGMGTQASLVLHPGVKAVYGTDMLEEKEQPLNSAERIAFSPFEIKTFLLLF